MTTQRLFAVILGAMAALMVFASVGGAYALAATAGVSNRLSDRISPAAIEVVNLRAALVDQETGVRGYLLSGEGDFLAPYQQGQDDEQAAVARIRSLLPDPPAALAQLDVVERSVGTWRGTVADAMVTAGTRRAGADVTDPLVALGKERFDTVRTNIGVLQSRVDVARTSARHALDQARSLRDDVFWSILVVFILGLVAIAVLLRTAVLRPLESLGRGARLVAAGDFDVPLPRSGPRDLVELADDLDGMRQQIALALSRSVEAGHKLEQQALELQRSNSDLEQFAYVASHDLQEPLRKVASFCQMLQRRYDATLDDRGRQYIAFAVDGATRMQALINDLLAFSRVGRVYDHIDTVAMDDTVGRAEQDLSRRIEEADARVERAALPVVRGDATLLTMLWQNLIGNALKFAQPGVPPVIVVEVAEDGDEWVFSVTDNGIGIEPQFAEKIFVIFQRLHPREQYPGTGIGLAICKRIVEFHGGRIWLDADHAGGAKVCFTMPRAAAPPDEPAASPRIPAA